MVVQGDVSVRLVKAESPHEAFAEYTGSDGKVYAEVIPDEEYFIELDNVGYSYNRSTLYAVFYIDGNHVPQVWYFTEGSALAGLYSRKNGTETTTSFRFKMLPVVGSSHTKAPMGSVRVQVFQGIHKETSPLSRYPYQSELARGVVHGLKEKKIVRTETGSTEIVKSISEKTEYTRGPFLDEVTIFYSTRSGLVDEGVLPRPSSQALHGWTQAYAAMEPAWFRAPFSSARKNHRAASTMGVTNDKDQALSSIKCPICLDTYNEDIGRVPCTLPCGHSLCIAHVRCIRECPICRVPTPNDPNAVKKNVTLCEASRAINAMMEACRLDS